MLNLEKGVKVCGRYTLEERIGTGGQGEVWRALDEAHGSVEVALKILHPEVARAPDAWETLRHEYEVAQRLGHRGIVEVGEPMRDESATVLPMTLAAGDLRRLRGEPYTRIVPALLEIAVAMEYAHSRGVIHRDLKASNVLIGSDGQINIADFGVAALDGVVPTGSPGSPFSASPQQIEGEPPMPADDVYGLGSLAYELLSGYPPYYPNFEPRVVIGEPVPDLLPIHAAPPRLVHLIMRMLAKDPSDRPESMRDVQEELHAALQDTISSGPDETAGALTTDLAATDVPGPRVGAAPTMDEAPAAVAVAVVASEEVVAEAGIDPDSTAQTRMPEVVATRGWPALKWAGLALLAAAIVGVFVVLPRIADSQRRAMPSPAVDARAVAAEAGDSAAQPTAPGAPSAAAVALDLFDAQQAAFTASLSALDTRAAAVWGGAAFAGAKSLGADAAAAMAAGNPELALDRIKVATRRLERVAAQAKEALTAQLAEGERALAAGQTALARQAFELALQIDPGSAAAQAGLKRSGGLASVLPILSEAENALRGNNPPRAMQLFEQVLRADPQNAAARDGLGRARAAAGSDEFARALGDALAALRGGRLDAARAALERARGLRPQSPEVAAGFANLASMATGRDLAAVRAAAADLEKQERWAEALAAFETVLARDPGIEFARSGRQRVAPRAELAGQLDGLITKPERLAAPEVRAEAQRLLVTARGTANGGPVLRSQVERVAQLLPTYEKPVKVQFESDGLTTVVVQRVRALGLFERQEVELKPGRYAVTGTRAGYRDVRREITVVPGAVAQVVVLRCVDPIQ